MPSASPRRCSSRLSSETPYAVGAVYSRTEGGRFVPLAMLGAERVEWDVPHRGNGPAACASRIALMARAGAVGAPADARGRSDHRPGGTGGGRQTSPTRASLWRRPRSEKQRCGSRPPCCSARSGRSPPPRSGAGWPERSTTASPRSWPRWGTWWTTSPPAPAEASDGDLEDELRGLRRELTRIISELRLSIFDLRSEVHADVGLGSALSDYVRAVGTGSPLTVHLILDEAPSRLRRRDRDRTHAHRPGGDHQRSPARRGREPVGDLPCRSATSIARVEDDGGWRQEATRTTASAWRSCANARARIGAEPVRQ